MISHLIPPIAQASADGTATSDSSETSKQFTESIVSFATEYGMNVLGAILILIVGNILAKFISKKISGLILKKHPEEPSLASIAKQVFYVALMIVVIIVVLGKFGVETASLIAVLGTAGLAIGVCLKTFIGFLILNSDSQNTLGFREATFNSPSLGVNGIAWVSRDLWGRAFAAMRHSYSSKSSRGFGLRTARPIGFELIPTP